MMFDTFRKLRGKSDTQSNTSADLQRINSITSATSASGKSKRSRSKSLTRRLSIFSNGSDDLLDQKSYASSGSDYINNNEYAELTRFKSLNYDKFNKTVLQYLKLQGLSAPKIIYDSSATGVRMAVTSSGENVFLPSLVVTSEEEIENFANLQNETQRNESRSNNASTASTVSNLNESDLNQPIVLQEEEARASSHPDDSVDPISHTFGVVVSLSKPTSIATISARLETNCKIKWPKGLPSDPNIKKEHFEIAQMNWELTLSNYNYFVPDNSLYQTHSDATAPDEQSISDDYYDYDGIDVDVDGSKFMTEQRIHSKLYELKSIDQVSRGGYSKFSHKGPISSDPFIAGNLQRNSGSVQYPPGDYIFLLPVQFPPSTPESLITEKSSVSHILRTIIVPKGNKTYYYGDEYVSILRGPPMIGINTADKPVYVNKVWSDSLNYEISFPKKFVAISSEIPIKMKFAPMTKNVSIKRIRVNILESVTYASKDMRYEYDEHSLRADLTEHHKNERLIPILEIKSQNKYSTSIREEFVSEDCLINGNLLSSCYQSNEEGYDEIIGPLKIESYLSFVKPQKQAKYYTDGDNPKNEKFINSVIHNVETSKKKSQVTKQLQTKLLNQGIKIIPTTSVHPFSDGLFPSSSHNRYIKIFHKLQVSLRIAKKLEVDDKTHNYEVMIDTPLIILNSNCVPESVELPAYEYHTLEDEVHLPSFEEAISPIASPYLGPNDVRSFGIEETNMLSRTSTMGPSGAYVDYNNIDDLVDPLTGFSLDRRPSTARSELLNNLKRTITNEANPDGIANDSEGEANGGRPPSYNEIEPLLTDAESLSSSYNSDGGPSYSVNPIRSQEELEEHSTDIIDQFRRVDLG